MKVLLSIKPEYVSKIFSGEKKFEYRKAIFKRADISTVVIYATQPVGKIVGEFHVDGIMENRPQKLWETTAVFSGISKEKFKNYFAGRDFGYAIRIGCPVEYEHAINPFDANPGFVPPQSFCYLD